MCFLNTHSKSYSLTLSDGLYSLVTGISGAPYASRHWELSKRADCSSVLGHRMIALIQYMPLIGALAALIERTVYFFKATKSSSKLPPERVDLLQDEKKEEVELNSFLAPRNATEKMWRNAEKAIEEHREINFQTQFVYASTEEALPPLEGMLDKKPCPLKLQYTVAEEEGTKGKMEDRQFFKEIEGGSLAGVFDGHGGKEVAILAQTEFQERFSDVLSKNHGNVHRTFTQLMNEIHTHVVEKKLKGGSTAVVCFIDSSSHLIYTATLADSEANIYRRINGQIKSIPLSCIRNWSTPKDARRAARYLTRKNLNEAKKFIDKFKESALISQVRLTGNRPRIDNIIKEIQLRALSRQPQNTKTYLTSGNLFKYCRDAVLDFIENNGPILTTNTTEGSTSLLALAKAVYNSLIKEYITEEKIYNFYRNNENKKKPRVKHINVSRSIGDVHVKAMSHKPKITVNQLYSGDRVVLCCDGVKDYVPERAIVEYLERSKDDSALSLVEFALEKYQSQDNVTVISIKVA